MKINYVEHSDGTKLFSFFRHDYKKYSKDDETIMIDGGIDYTRFSGKIKEKEIKDLIKDVREQFTWGQNYDKNNVRLNKTNYILLKDMTTGHIINVLLYFTQGIGGEVDTIDKNRTVTKQWFVIHEIFLQELKFRNDEEV